MGQLRMFLFFCWQNCSYCILVLHGSIGSAMQNLCQQKTTNFLNFFIMKMCVFVSYFWLVAPYSTIFKHLKNFIDFAQNQLKISLGQPIGIVSPEYIFTLKSLSPGLKSSHPSSHSSWDANTILWLFFVFRSEVWNRPSVPVPPAMSVLRLEPG